MIGNNLLYAFNKDGNLVSVNEVERGLACNCICPSCGSKLEARKGNIRVHHFAHYQNPTCENGYQTSLHLLAIKLITEKRMIKIPPVDCDKYYEDLNSNEGYRVVNERIKDEKLLTDIDVYQEKKENGIIPDIIVQSGEYKLYVEIYVTHKVDEEKKKIVMQNDISMMEINLCNLDREISEEELSKYLFEDTSKSVWINNKIYNNEYAKQQEIKKQFIEKYKDYGHKRGTKSRKVIFVDEENRKKRNQKYIELCECPKCHAPLIKSQMKKIMIVCSRNMDHAIILTTEQETKILKILKDEPVYDYQQYYIHQSKCLECKNSLFIQKDKSGSFVKCTNCKFRVEPELEKYLSNNMKEMISS